MLNYNIENTSIVRGKNNFLLKIKGWAFDSEKKISFEVYDELGMKYPYSCVNEIRNDVYKYFDNSPNALESGIQIEMENINKNTRFIQIHFLDEDQAEIAVHIVDIKQLMKVCYPKKISIENFAKVKKSVKRDGIAVTCKKIVQKLIGALDEDLEAARILEPYVFHDINFSYAPQKEYNIIAVLNGTSNTITQEDYNSTLESIIKQKVKQLFILINVKTKIEIQYNTLESKLVTHIITVDNELKGNRDVLQYLQENISGINGSFVTLISTGDILANSFMSKTYEALDNSGLIVITCDEDRICNGKYIAPFYKKYAIQNNRPLDLILRKSLTIHESMIVKYIEGKLELKDIYVIEKTLYHYKLSMIDERINVKPIAFYLPQFHSFPENDEWWGKGFTEWTNTRTGTPLFDGHYQPHNPGELGYYDLIEDSSIQLKQINLAKEYGIYGFCYYYYWFNGKRLMEKPLDRILANKDIDFPFCICWANETWSRRWDGQDKEILIRQEHNEETDNKFIEDIIPILKDERYIKIGNAPILIIYRAELFPDLEKTISIWKQKCKEQGIEDLHVSLIQTFGLSNPTIYGGDSAIEFPPHSIVTGNIAHNMPKLNKSFIGNIYDYRDVVARCLNKKPNCYKVFRGCMLGWDNTARRKNASNIFQYSEPEEYRKWLSGIIDYTVTYNDDDEQFIFINAWNEWAEGTHLEPDEKYGRAYLEMTKNVLESNY